MIELLCYVDDNFGFEEEGKVEFYPPYGAYFPVKQTRLLKLWDLVGLPHERPKQLYGPILTVIGFEIDPNAMTATLPAENKAILLEHLDSFRQVTAGHRCRTLRKFQQLTGHINWAFNVYPLLRPGLSTVYAKMAGKSHPHAGIYINKAIQSDLDWLANHVRNGTGIRFMGATEWESDDLDLSDPLVEVAFVDASSQGIGLYFPWLQHGYYAELPGKAPRDTIFFFEALAVCCAIHKAAKLNLAGRTIR